MELKDLVGIHVMNGIEIGTVKSESRCWKELEDCNYVKFSLDTTTYMAVEDPEDGYRSCCRELEIVDDKCKITLPDILVECKMRDNSHVMFVAGISATCMIGKFVIVPGIAMDISKLSYEGALNAYKVGYTDGAQKSSDGYDIYFNEEVMDEINNWEYKYIK